MLDTHVFGLESRDGSMDSASSKNSTIGIKGIANAPLVEVIRGVLPYVVLMLIGLALVLLFEPLALWLPQLAGFGV